MLLGGFGSRGDERFALREDGSLGNRIPMAARVNDFCCVAGACVYETHLFALSHTKCHFEQKGYDRRKRNPSPSLCCTSVECLNLEGSLGEEWCTLPPLPGGRHLRNPELRIVGAKLFILGGTFVQNGGLIFVQIL